FKSPIPSRCVDASANGQAPGTRRDRFRRTGSDRANPGASTMTPKDTSEPSKTPPIRDLHNDEIDGVSGGAAPTTPGWIDPDPLPLQSPKSPGWIDPDYDPAR